MTAEDTYKTIAEPSEGIYTEKRSKFIAIALPVRTLDEIKAHLETYQKKYYDARHVCYAYMLGAARKDFRANDNGEPSGTAGKPILGQINSNELTDILIIVVRYFGGIKLGTSGLIVAYKAAAALGLTTNCKIAAGAGDNAAAAVGTGTVGDGGCNISLGTSGTIFISSKEFGVDRFNALHSFDHADGNFHLMGCMLSAASCNKWWMDEIIGTKDYGKEQEPITDDKLGENNVYYLPYLMGERSPHNNPDARALFIGMSMDTTRADMTQAVLEGVAFAMRDCYEIAKDLGINITETKICGGGAKSPLWRKIMANVLNINVNIIESEEGPGLGGAMLAAVACGEYASVQEAADKIVKVIGTEKPDPALAAKYDKKYAKFKEIYPTVKGLYDTLKA